MQGQVVAITGASRGIGAAAARIFAAEGARVALLSRNAGAIAELADSIGPQAMALPCDVASWPEVTGAVGQIVSEWGGIDVWINNAGVIDPIARLEHADPAAWARLIDINLTGVFHGIRAVLPVMKPQRRGTIRTVSSGAAHRPLEGWSAYCATKAGALMLTQAAHLEEAEHGIRVLGLSPGTVATEMQVKIKASGINPVSALAWEDHIPADWPARALLWMCGPGAESYRGQEISLREDSIRRAVGLI